MKSLILLSLVGAVFTAPQSIQIIRNNAVNGDSGRYIADNSGAYTGDDGRYRHDDSGLYRDNVLKTYQGVDTVRTRIPANYNTVNRDLSGQYIHDNSGAYNNNDGQYHPDGSGQYNPDGSGLYKDNLVNYQQTFNTNKNNINAGTVTVKPVYAAPIYPGSNSGVRDHYVGSNDGRYAIIRQLQENLPEGYHYLYETENQINGEEEGHLEKVGQDQEGINVRGRYSYTGPDNVVYSVEYTADAEHGFVASGAHLP